MDGSYASEASIEPMFIAPAETAKTATVINHILNLKQGKNVLTSYHKVNSIKLTIICIEKMTTQIISNEYRLSHKQIDTKKAFTLKGTMKNKFEISNDDRLFSCTTCQKARSTSSDT